MKSFSKIIICFLMIMSFSVSICYAEAWNFLGYYNNYSYAFYNDTTNTKWNKRYIKNEGAYIWNIDTTILEKTGENYIPVRKYKISYRIVELHHIGVPVSYKISKMWRWNNKDKAWEEEKNVDKKRYKIGKDSPREKIGIYLFKEYRNK